METCLNESHEKTEKKWELLLLRIVVITQLSITKNKLQGIGYGIFNQEVHLKYSITTQTTITTAIVLSSNKIISTF